MGSGSSLRVECRIPGADCNPYLVYASALAAGLDGIEKQTEPPAIFEGNAYAASEVTHVPKTLAEAAELFASSDFARQAFGEEVTAHYTHFFRSEQQAFDKAVTDWERKHLRANMTKQSPLIGITTYGANEKNEFTLPVEYVACVRRAGGIPVLVPPGEPQVEALLGRLDGVVLAGGGRYMPELLRRPAA